MIEEGRQAAKREASQKTSQPVNLDHLLEALMYWPIVKVTIVGAAVVAQAVLYPHDATPFATEAACREVLSAIARDLEANDKEFKAFLNEAGADAKVTFAPDCTDEQPAKYIAEMRGEDT
jgi:hypothetical protein